MSAECPCECQDVNPVKYADARGTVKNVKMGRLRHTRRTVDGQSINRACRDVPVPDAGTCTPHPPRMTTKHHGRSRDAQNCADHDEKTRRTLGGRSKRENDKKTRTLEGRSNCAEHYEKTRRMLGGRSKYENALKTPRTLEVRETGVPKGVENVRQSR